MRTRNSHWGFTGIWGLKFCRISKEAQIVMILVLSKNCITVCYFHRKVQ